MYFLLETVIPSSYSQRRPIGRKIPFQKLSRFVQVRFSPKTAICTIFQKVKKACIFDNLLIAVSSQHPNLPIFYNMFNLLIAVASQKYPFSNSYLGPESCFTKKSLKSTCFAYVSLPEVIFYPHLSRFVESTLRESRPIFAIPSSTWDLRTMHRSEKRSWRSMQRFLLWIFRGGAWCVFVVSWESKLTWPVAKL